MMFEDFATEKEHYRTNESDYSNPWGCAFDVDRDILPFVYAVNSLPFAFTKGMSCSGSFEDHASIGGNGILYETSVFDKLVESSNPNYEFPLKTSSRNERFGARLHEPQGYAVLRVDTRHEQWSALEATLQAEPNSLLLEQDKWERADLRDLDKTPHAKTMSYQIFLPEEQRQDNPKDKSHMRFIWFFLAHKISSL